MLKINNFFDELIGELQKDTITTIYGPPGCGKSTICFQYAISCVRLGKKVLYVDTEGGFSAERIKQMMPEIDLSQIIVFSPKDFEEQKKVISNLNKQIKNSSSIGLIVIDSLVMLYRLKLEGAPQKINTELAIQLQLLTEISRSFHIPIIVTNQMYQNFDTKEKKMVGGSLIEYWSKTIIELDKEQDIRFAILKKHKYKKEGEAKKFEIVQNGIIESKARGFNLFK